MELNLPLNTVGVLQRPGPSPGCRLLPSPLAGPPGLLLGGWLEPSKVEWGLLPFCGLGHLLLVVDMFPGAAGALSIVPCPAKGSGLRVSTARVGWLPGPALQARAKLSNNCVCSVEQVS